MQPTFRRYQHHYSFSLFVLAFFRNSVASARNWYESSVMKKHLGFALILSAGWQLCAGESNAIVAPYILTPPASLTPRINGANVFGVRPGSPFLFTIPATGKRPMRFSAQNLPRGLKLDSETGLITGVLEEKGESIVTLRAENSLGAAEKPFHIICGDQIALTPPMGWNTWNAFGAGISAKLVKRQAEALVRSGLINHGFTYINIDDFWQNQRNSKDLTLPGKFRNPDGSILSNSNFSDMKELADYVHRLGLKIGLYSSPGPWTCGNCEGSLGHEQQDARTYAEWGIDFLKYDWCSYGGIASGKMTNGANLPLWHGTAASIEGAIYPYRLMGKYLREQNRDIVFSLCQYGIGEVWKWGNQVGGNTWRTTGDMTDQWEKPKTPEWLGSVRSIGFHQDQAAPFAKPGNWNDPDMLVVGVVRGPHPTRLTPDEQYSHISLWCLLSAPLFIGCDLEKLDAFTLNLLSNDEVLALDQDVLGKQATCVLTRGNLKVYEKELADGGRAFGVFNLGEESVKMDFTGLTQFGLTGKQHVRDLWRQVDLADVNIADGALPLVLPIHGVLLYKLTPEAGLQSAR